MTSYDRYLEYVRSPPFYFHHQCQHFRHQLQQLDETGGGPGWRTSGLGVEGLTADSRPSVLGRQHATTPTTAVDGSDGSRRRPAPPAFTIDAILSSTGMTTGSGIAESTSGADWSRVQLQQTTAAGGCQLETATQLTKEASSISCFGATRSRAGRGSGKRVRTIFTQEQLDRLEKEFERQQYMVGTERCYLAAQLGLVEAQVKVWFQNRRIKWRRQAADAQRRHLAAAASVDNCSNGGGGLVVSYPVLVGGPPSSSASAPHDTATSSSLSATSDSSRASSPDFDVTADFRFDATGSATCNGDSDDVIDLRRTCV